MTLRLCRVCARFSDREDGETCPFCKAKIERIVKAEREAGGTARRVTVRRDGDTDAERPFIVVCSGCGARGASPVEPKADQQALCPRCVLLRVEQ